MTADLALLRALYSGPNLVDMGDGLASQLSELARDFTPERAESAARNLEAAALVVRRIAAEKEVAR